MDTYIVGVSAREICDALLIPPTPPTLRSTAHLEETESFLAIAGYRGAFRTALHLYFSGDLELTQYRQDDPYELSLRTSHGGILVTTRPTDADERPHTLVVGGKILEQLHAIAGGVRPLVKRELQRRGLALPHLTI